MSSITPIELRVIETVLGMGGGYVLDFNNRSFEDFFGSHRVAIYDQRYASDGSSKANRLRCFLRTAPDTLAGQILAGLLEFREAAGTAPETRKQDLDRYAATVARLGGRLAPSATASAGGGTETDLLKLVFKPESFAALPIDGAMNQVLVARMAEAQRCIDAKAYLSAVILCGSVLEGMCLGYGAAHPEQVNRGYTAQFGRDPKKLPDWHLSEWIDVLAKVGVLSQNVLKFGVGLRDFRNYVHPAAQLATGFAPDMHTARIGFQVVVAAVDDFVKATAKP
jgi:hypothetical protein